MKSRSNTGGLVYSTDRGRMCPACRQPATLCTCKAAASQPKGEDSVRVQLESKGRAGKGVTVVRGLPLAADELTAFGKQLKTACGSGGTVKDGVIEVQGDHVERVMAELKKWGYAVKRSGG